MARDPWAEASRRFARIEHAVNRGARRAEAEGASTFASLAGLLAPVETGRLRDAITGHDDGTVTIEGEGEGSPAEYYDIVETGGETAPGSHQAPQPFLRPAASLVALAIPAIARRAIAAEVAAEVARMRGGRRR
jgi:hypothetical protein